MRCITSGDHWSMEDIHDDSYAQTVAFKLLCEQKLPSFYRFFSCQF